MKLLKQTILSTFLLFFSYFNSFAVEPDELLLDSSLEDRARLISSELRCLVCRNENIDSSNADLARDLRMLVRESIMRGASAQEVLSYNQSRYGDFVLLRPKFSGASIILWMIGPISVVIGLFLIYFILFREKKSNMQTYYIKPLSKYEENEIRKLLDD